MRRHFNSSTIKVSYSTTKNMKAHIDKHNRQVLNPKVDTTEPSGCNCKKSDDCPLSGNCVQKSVVYQADVNNNIDPKMTYYGLTENTFKSRFYGHKSSFKNEEKKGSTALSKYVWKLINENKPATVKWSIKARSFAYKPGSRHCDLCLVEKTTIALADPACTLNSRTEIMAKCRHKRKYCLSKF